MAFAAPESLAGSRVECPGCRQPAAVPDLEPGEAPAQRLEFADSPGAPEPPRGTHARSRPIFAKKRGFGRSLAAPFRRRPRRYKEADPAEVHHRRRNAVLALFGVLVALGIGAAIFLLVVRAKSRPGDDPLRELAAFADEWVAAVESADAARLASWCTGGPERQQAVLSYYSKAFGRVRVRVHDHRASSELFGVQRKGARLRIAWNVEYTNVQTGQVTPRRHTVGLVMKKDAQGTWWVESPWPLPTDLYPEPPP